MRIALASDHRGFSAKEKIKAYLVSKGHEVLDFGCNSNASCDYPDSALPAAECVASSRSDVGILMCGTGIGMSMTANKVRGVRAALCHDELTAQLSRAHNNANVLCLPADLIGEELMRRVIDVWLGTRFDAGRHERRVAKIVEYEARCQSDARPGGSTGACSAS